MQVADAKQGWTIRLEDGKYDLDLKGSSDSVQLDKQTVTVQRREKQIVRITLKADNQTAADRQIAKAPGEPTQSPSGACFSPRPVCGERGRGGAKTFSPRPVCGERGRG